MYLGDRTVERVSAFRGTIRVIVSLFVNRIRSRFCLITRVIRVTIYERLLLMDSPYLFNFVRLISYVAPPSYNLKVKGFFQVFNLIIFLRVIFFRCKIFQ